MTRDEFMRARAVAHHVKTVGVTHCAPGSASAEPLAHYTVRARGVNGKRMNKLSIVNAAQRITGPSIDTESGQPVPVRAQRAQTR